MKVLFVFFTDPPRPFSSSVAALSAIARAAGHTPVALEVSLRESIAGVVERVMGISPDVVAVSAMSRDWPGAQTLLRALRPQLSAYIVVGGYHATMAPLDVASCSAVDAIGIGEGDRPLRALLDRLDAGQRPESSLPGLWVRREDGWTDPLPGADPEPDIAALPWWDYEVFGDVGAGLTAGINTFGPRVDRFLPTRASRGCPFTCSYCSAPTWGRVNGFAKPSRRNTRPVEHLCEELAMLRDRFSPEGFELWDEHFPLQLDWLRELAEVYPRRVGLPFKVEMHPSAASRERLELLARAGCVLFHCGVETGDEDLRRNVLNRRTKDAELQRVFDDARSLGLATSASLMTVLPGETRAQSRATVELLRRLRPDSLMWSTYHALPGTVLGEASVPGWPGAARERFDDYDAVPPRIPTGLDAAERNATFLELTDLQSELVRAAGGAARERPVEIPTAPRPASRALAALLGLEPPSAPLEGDRMRVNCASFERGAVQLEVESAEMSPRQIVVAERSASGHYVATSQLALSYRGREAPAQLRRALDAMAKRLEPFGLDDVLRALD